MKLIRHVLSHLLLFILLVAVGAVYFYRHQVLPDRYAQQIEQFAEKLHPKLAEFSYRKGIQTAQQAAEEDAVQHELTKQLEKNIDVIYVDDVPLVQEPDSKVAAKQEAKDKITAVTNPQAIEEQPGQQEVVEAASEKAKTDAVAVNKEEQGTEENQETAATDDKAAADYLTVLRDARTAFGQGNMELAVKKYNELIELENDEADFHGELGNVYYAMGKWDQAGASYYEAATRLIDNGQFSQVGYLQRVLQGLDAERAEKLAQQMANTQRK